MHKGINTRRQDLLADMLEISVLGVSEPLNIYSYIMFLFSFP